MESLGSASTSKGEVEAVDKLEDALSETPGSVESHVETIAFIEFFRCPPTQPKIVSLVSINKTMDHGRISEAAPSAR